jgi:DNA-binding beta-propeller fold protein YncE
VKSVAYYLSLLVVIAAMPAAAAPSGPMTAASPIPVARKPGFFDYMAVDAKLRRLLVAHSSNSQLAIVDLVAGAVISQVDLGRDSGGAGVAVDERDGKYFVGAVDDKVVDINRKYMVLQAYIPLPGPVDAIAFDEKNDTLYADEDGGTHLWAINGKTDKVVAAIAIPQGPEYVDYDPVSDRIYQNIEPDPSGVVVVDPHANSVTVRWPVAPAARVHGLAIDGAAGRLFSVGANGTLAVVDLKTGAVLTTVTVADRVDQIAFDPGNRRVYCPSGTGVMSIVQESDAGAALLGDVSIPRGAHTVAVDPVTHGVWISYGGVDNDYVQEFTPNP